MKYIYRIIFMPVVILVTVILALEAILELLFTGRYIGGHFDDTIAKYFMPLIRLMG